MWLPVEPTALVFKAHPPIAIVDPSKMLLTLVRRRADRKF
jgi:hypothetical protein